MTDPRNLGLLVASLLVGLALFELGARHVGLDYNLSPNWRYHPVLGWTQVPGAAYDMVIEGRPVRVRFNTMGFRDDEHRLAKPRGVKRIVVIGDSFSEAVQVNLHETFHQRLEALLNQDGAATWEVINLAVGDFGPAQEYIALERYGLAFDPDIVIQQIFPLNDICNSSLGLYGLCRSHNDRYRPYFVEAGDSLQEVYGQPLRARLRRHLVSYRVVEYWMLRLTGFDPQSPEDPGRPRRLRSRGFQGLDPLLYTFVDTTQLPEAVAQGWRMTEELLTRAVRATRERGILYLGLVVPFESRLGPGWEQFARSQPPPPMSRGHPERRLGALFDRLGVGSIMLADAFQPHLDEVLPYVGGHLSVAGHRRAAEALYGKLVRRGIATPGRDR